MLVAAAGGVDGVRHWRTVDAQNDVVACPLAGVPLHTFSDRCHLEEGHVGAEVAARQLRPSDDAAAIET